MTATSTHSMDQQVSSIVSDINVEQWTRQYWEQGEFLALEHLMPKALVEEFMQEVDAVRSKINRNFIPKHKKGGSVSYYLLQEYAPRHACFLSKYRMDKPAQSSRRSAVITVS